MWRHSIRLVAPLIIAGCTAAITMLMWAPIVTILQALLVLGLFAGAIVVAAVANQWTN